MNDENIAELSIELDKIIKLIPSGSTFTSKWLTNEYNSVVESRARGWQTYRNEYRIIKTLLTARSKVLLANRDKLVLFVPLFKIMKSIETSLKEEFENQKLIKIVDAELETITNSLNSLNSNSNSNSKTVNSNSNYDLETILNFKPEPVNSVNFTDVNSIDPEINDQ